MGFNLLTFATADLWEWGQVVDNQRVKQRQKKDAENWSSISVWNAINIIISLYHTKTLLYWVSPIFKGFLKDSRDLYLCKWYRVLWNEHEKFRHAFLSLLHLERGTERWNNFQKNIVIDLEAEPSDLNLSSGSELKSFSPSLIRQEFNELWKQRKLYIGSVDRIRHWYVWVLEKQPAYNSSSCTTKDWGANLFIHRANDYLKPWHYMPRLTVVYNLHCVTPKHCPPHGEVAAIPPIA